MDYSINTQPLLYNTDSEDETNLHSIQEENEALANDRPVYKLVVPRDKYNLAYITFYLLGVITLLPWNFFITADDYWLYKFRDVSSNVTMTKRSPLQASFTSYLSVASAVPNLAFLIINTAFSHRVSLHKRINGSLLCMLILFIVTTVFVNVNTDKWQQQFFIITMLIVVLLNSASAVLSGSLFGIMGKFCPKYITATIGGQALGGVFAAVSQISALAIGASSVHSAFVYFMVGNLMLFISFAMYILLSRTVFFKFHISDRMGIATNEFDSELRPRIVDHKVITKKIWPHALSMFLVFWVSSSVFPGVTVLIESEHKGKGHIWSNVYFVPVVSYLLFNMGDYTGRLIAGLIQKPRSGSFMITLTVLRLVFVPMLLFCNAQPRHNIPVYFNQDYIYITIMVVFGLSNGYLANLPFLCVPRIVEHHEKEAASSIMTVFLGLGLVCGSTICLFIVNVL